MKNASVCVAAVVMVLLAGSAHAAPPVVNAEQMDMGTDITAKIGKEKSKRSMQSAGMNSEQGAGGGSSGCGTVNINSNDKKSNSGIKDMFGKQSTTIVTGPVINMANCK